MKKNIVIIGASSGIGQEVARLLLSKGHRLGIAARREDRLRAIQQEASDRVVTAAIDVTSDDAPQRLRALIDELDGMDTLVYSSGVGKQNRELTPEIELNTVNTNAMGFARMIGEAYRYFAESGREGHIAAITSIAGTKGLGPAPSYSATKALQSNYLQALEQQSNARGLNIYFTDIRLVKKPFTRVFSSFCRVIILSGTEFPQRLTVIGSRSLSPTARKRSTNGQE